MKRTFSLLVAVLMVYLHRPSTIIRYFIRRSGSEILVGEVGGATYPGTLYGFSKSADGTWTEAYPDECSRWRRISGWVLGRAVASNGQQLIVGSGPQKHSITSTVGIVTVVGMQVLH